MVPKTLALLFWDIRLEDFDPRAYPVYAIERVLEYGDDAAVAWMYGMFSEDEICGVLRHSRRLTPLSANFWALIFGVSPSEVASFHRAA